LLALPNAPNSTNTDPKHHKTFKLLKAGSF
jgi:hypothetical protein